MAGRQLSNEEEGGTINAEEEEEEEEEEGEEEEDGCGVENCCTVEPRRACDKLFVGGVMSPPLDGDISDDDGGEDM